MSDFSNLELNSLSGLKDLASDQGNDNTLTRMFQTGFRALLNGGSSVSGAASDLLGGSGGVFDDQFELIRLQVQIQRELQQTSLLSNVTKSRHEARMAAVRNMRP